MDRSAGHSDWPDRLATDDGAAGKDLTKSSSKLVGAVRKKIIRKLETTIYVITLGRMKCKMLHRGSDANYILS